MIRALILITLAATISAADQAGPPTPPKPDPVTADDLQNLVVCARRQLPALSPDEITAVAQSIKRAEAQIAAMRAAEAKPVEKH